MASQDALIFALAPHSWSSFSGKSIFLPTGVLFTIHNLYEQTPPEEGPEQIVILAQILASPVTVGYRAGGWCVRLKKFNDVHTPLLEDCI